MSRNTEAALAQAACAARDRAYAPYSRHPVGAAIEDETGAIHVGCNVENAAYPEGVCAEASAISAMVMAGGTRIVAVAVAGPSTLPCAPCGGCRQKIREFSRPDVAVILCADTGILERHTLADLLPHAFGPDNLDR